MICQEDVARSHSRRPFLLLFAAAILLALAGCTDDTPTHPEPALGLLPGSLELLSQADVDAVDGVEEVTGDLIIGPSFDIVSLSPLNRLTRVGGRLEIRGNHSLKSLLALDGLREAGSLLFLGASPENLRTSAAVSVFVPRRNRNESIGPSWPPAAFW